MTVPPRRRKQRGLARELAGWVAVSTTIGLCVFAAIAVVVLITDEEAELNHDTTEVILREARNEVGGAMLIAGPVGLLLAVGGAAFATRRVLRPLQSVIDSATHLTVRELDMRLPLPAAENELQALVLAFNGLLSRLESGFGALDRFAADASHELRTPLTVMATELEVMLGGVRSEADWMRSAELCLSEVRSLTQLVDALLHMARVERAPEPASLTATSRGVQLEAELGEETNCSVDGNAHALMSALTNVLDNAVRYTPTGGQIQISSAADALGRVLLHIDDNGAGIDPLEQQRIFEPFMRGAAGRASANGFGLGLSIARRICEHNQTLLSVSRSPSGGARFSFSFHTLAE
jgi:signal transduction histidine kinase